MILALKRIAASDAAKPCSGRKGQRRAACLSSFRQPVGSNEVKKTGMGRRYACKME